MKQIGIGVLLALMVFLAVASVASAQGPYGWASYNYYPYPTYAPAYVNGYYHGYNDGFYWGYQEGYRDGYCSTCYGPYYYSSYGYSPSPASYVTGTYQVQRFLDGGTPYVTHCQLYGSNYPAGVCK